jgi:hypothetical protein
MAAELAELHALGEADENGEPLGIGRDPAGTIAQRAKLGACAHHFSAYDQRRSLFGRRRSVPSHGCGRGRCAYRYVCATRAAERGDEHGDCGDCREEDEGSGHAPRGAASTAPRAREVLAPRLRRPWSHAPTNAPHRSPNRGAAEQRGTTRRDTPARGGSAPGLQHRAGRLRARTPERVPHMRRSRSLHSHSRRRAHAP